MPKPIKSQWDFGDELFPTEAMRRVFSVSELTTDVRRLLEKQIGVVWVSGEISNFRLQSSGHIYFTLKDANAQLGCVLFRNDPVAGREALQDGNKVVLKGEMTVYEARGQYQIHVLAIEAQGVGALQIAFEKLKQKLNAEGLFAQERKRPLPRFPHRIGLVTSPTGAAIRDILHVVERRNPMLELVLAGCAVQGAGAANEIAGAIRTLNDWSERGPAKLDLILVTRGGGSLEDLWAFNEEVVARAISKSALPVISAVGHEIDFTISDFVADFRAATPSAAAEIITEGVYSGCRWMAELPARMAERVRQRVAHERVHVSQAAQRVARCHPRRELQEKTQRLDEVQLSMSRCFRHDLGKLRLALQNLRERFGRVRPEFIVAQRRESMAQKERRLHEQARHQLRSLQHRWESLSARLRLLGPEQVLARGYSITQDATTGEIITSADSTHPGQTLKTKLKTGEVQSTVK